LAPDSGQDSDLVKGARSTVQVAGHGGKRGGGSERFFFEKLHVYSFVF